MSEPKETTLEINTKHGKLIVTTTLKNDRPQNVIIEKIENEKKIALEKFVCKTEEKKEEILGIEEPAPAVLLPDDEEEILIVKTVKVGIG